MIVSARTLQGMGLGLLGVGFLVATSFAQQAKDAAVSKTASQPAPATKPAPPPPAVFGTVDLEAVLNGYDKFKVQKEEYGAAAKAKHAELMKIQTTAQEEASRLAKMTPGSVDAKKIEDTLTQLKAQMEAGKEQAQRDFALRESEMMAGMYKEVQAMVAAAARHMGMTYVVRVSNKTVEGSNPDSVMAAMASTVVYADPKNDITQFVIAQLNNNYKRAGGITPKATAPAGN